MASPFLSFNFRTLTKRPDTLSRKRVGTAWGMRRMDNASRAEKGKWRKVALSLCYVAVSMPRIAAEWPMR